MTPSFTHHGDIITHPLPPLLPCTTPLPPIPTPMPQTRLLNATCSRYCTQTVVCLKCWMDTSAAPQFTTVLLLRCSDNFVVRIAFLAKEVHGRKYDTALLLD